MMTLQVEGVRIVFWQCKRMVPCHFHKHKPNYLSLSLLWLCSQHIEEMETSDLQASTDQAGPPCLVAQPDPPANLVCPITRCLFEDPVMVVETGHTYERRAIEEHFLVNGSTNPLTSKQRSCRVRPQASGTPQ
jgi:hypothetical protein